MPLHRLDQPAIPFIVGRLDRKVTLEPPDGIQPTASPCHPPHSVAATFIHTGNKSLTGIEPLTGNEPATGAGSLEHHCGQQVNLREVPAADSGRGTVHQ